MTKSWSEAQSERYRQLAELWQRADQLDVKGIERLCLLVVEILSRCAKTNLAETGQSIDDLIHAYLVERVLTRLQLDPEKFKAQMPTSHGALILFFQNFVISHSRRSESRLTRQAETLETESGDIWPAVEQHFDPESLVDRLQAEGFSMAQLEVEVQVFLDNMNPLERQLLDNYCESEQLSIAKLFPDAPHLQSLARVAVAQMGLWYGKTGKRDLAQFGQTRLGRFMARMVGQPLDESHRETVQVLMCLIRQLA